MKQKTDTILSSYARFSRLLLIAAGVLVLASLACLGFRIGRISNPPARASVVPSNAAQATAPQGFVCRSPHFTLTAEIHAGS